MNLRIKKSISSRCMINILKKLRFVRQTLGVGLLGTFASSALAVEATDTKVRICNKSDLRIFTAVAYEDAAPNAGIMARGWWGVEANNCIELPLPLHSSRLLLHAQASSQLLQWTGQVPLCIDGTSAFNFADAAKRDCHGTNQEIRAFREVSVPALAAVSADGVPTFNFLPTETVRVGSAVKFCNDTTENVFLSYGQKQSTDAKTRVNGWLSIKPNTCHEGLRTTGANEVVFYAQAAGGKSKWRGNVPLCTDDYHGYTFEEAGSESCLGNNQRTQLFRKMPLPVTGDFEFRFTVSDAYTVRSTVDLCNSRTEKSMMAIAWSNPDVAGSLIATGWFVLDSKACAKDLPIDAAELLVHAEKADRSLLTDGSVETCINHSEAFSFSKSNVMPCTNPALVKAKFKPVALVPGKNQINVP